jgi:four helix bundle protein
MSAKTYRGLLTWRKAMQLVEDIYKAVSQFPRSEIYGLRSQIQRAAISIPSNIAEGYERRSLAEYLRFIAIALGSVAELETQVLLAQRLNYLTADTATSCSVKQINSAG